MYSIDIIKKLENSNNSIYKDLEYIESENITLFKEIVSTSLLNWTNYDRVNEVIEYIKSKNHLKKYLHNKNYFDAITKKSNNLLSLKEYTSNDFLINKKIAKIIDQNARLFTKQILNKAIKDFRMEYDIIPTNLKIIEQINYLIIKEIVDNEKVKISSIKLIGRGEFSDVYQIGNKIIKLGKKRGTKTFPNNPYIVKPLLRKEFELGEKTKIFVEVCEKILTNCCTKEDVDEIYKKMRRLGLVWIDVKQKNLGKLLKDNKIYWNKPLSPSDTALMLQEYRGSEELKKGDVVICDADYIYDESGKNYNIQRVAEYELKFKKEKNLK